MPFKNIAAIKQNENLVNKNSKTIYTSNFTTDKNVQNEVNTVRKKDQPDSDAHEIHIIPRQFSNISQLQ